MYCPGFNSVSAVSAILGQGDVIEICFCLVMRLLVSDLGLCRHNQPKGLQH